MPAAIRYFLAFLTVFVVSSSCNRPQQINFTEDPFVEIDLHQIRKRGYINVLVDNNSISYFIYKGQPMGYEYELLNLLARQLNVDLKIKVTSGVERAIDLLNKGEGDILAFPLTVTKDRTRYVSFTKAHFNSYQVLVQRKPADWRKMLPD